MVGLTALFGLRVLGQVIQRWAPQSFLPPFAAFQGSQLPYPFLLSAQLLILGWMIGSCRLAKVAAPAVVYPWTLALACFGTLYMASSLARIAIGLSVPTAAAWFRAWISEFFHIVLAAFVLLVAYERRRPRPLSNNGLSACP
jgi:hypothetical protein